MIANMCHISAPSKLSSGDMVSMEQLYFSNFVKGLNTE